MDETASRRDTLYRCLYLRREYAALQARAAAQAEEQERERLGLATTAAASSSSPAPPSHVASAPALPYQDEATPTASAIPLDDLRDIILMPPHNAAMGIGSCGEAGARLGGISPLLTPAPASNSGIGGAAGTRAIGTDPMLREAFGWPGLVFIRNLPSPWYNGCFPFTVYFPSRYPFEAPIIELAGPLRSHPHVHESRVRDLEELGIGALGASMHTVDVLDTPLASSMTKTSASSLFSANKRYFIPFEDVYCGLDPMRVSVLSRLLQHVKRFFYPTEWPAAWQQQQAQQRSSSRLSTTTSPTGTASEPYVNRVLARRDVDRRSATQEVVLGKPYVDYLGSDVLQHFLAAWEERTGRNLAVVCPSLGGVPSQPGEEEGDEAEKAGEIVFASWYNRSVLPHVLALP